MEAKQPIPEQQVRAQIDQKLILAGWVIQDKKWLKLGFHRHISQKTIGFFGHNLVSGYTHENAVSDFEIRDRLTKQKRLKVLF